MNYAGSTDATFSHTHSRHAYLHVDSSQVHAPSDSVVVPDAQLLFHANYARSGTDLILSRDDHSFVLHDYFKGEKRAPLASPDGAYLTPDIVKALVGEHDVAQAGNAPAASQIIGHITKLQGSATVIRNGASVIVNMGDNVEKGDVVVSEANSSVGITFIDGTVFGLGPNARMVLNEMIYDPNSSNNSSLLSLVAGTISFVAGATAKHGDMKIDTPVATMGIRGTAVLVEIDFSTAGPNGQPNASFQVLVEPDGTTGSYILFDKSTLQPIAVVNQAGQQININNGIISQTTTPLSPDIQKLITDVFQQKFTDIGNTNTKTAAPFNDSITPQFGPLIKLANGTSAQPLFVVTNTAGHSGSDHSQTAQSLNPPHIPGTLALQSVPQNTFATSELAGKTGDVFDFDTVGGRFLYQDINPADRPTVTAEFASVTYKNASGSFVIGAGQTAPPAGLTAEQFADISATAIKLFLVPGADNANNGSFTWLYSLRDSAFDFLAAGETLTFTYHVTAHSNFAPDPETQTVDIIITVTGTNDAPAITATNASFTELSGSGQATIDHAGGTIGFTDVDLTDRPVVSTAFTSFTFRDSHGNDIPLTAEQQADILAVEAPLTLTPGANTNNGTVAWSYDVADSLFGFMDAGDILTLTYTATVNDGHGGITSTPVTVTVRGTSAHLIVERPGVTGDSIDVDTTSGKVAFSQFGVQSASATLSSISWSGGATLPTGLATILSGAVSTTVGFQSVGFDFQVKDVNFDFLAAGETLTITYDVTALGTGGSSTRPFTITVIGTNDTPTIAATSNSFSELANESQPNPTGSGTLDTVSGTISFADVDLTDRPVASAAFTSFTYTDAGHHPLTLTQQQLADITAVEIPLTVVQGAGNTNNGQASWTYSLADKNFDFLAAGEILTLTYTATVDDGHGGVVSTPFTVTIVGTNDTPTIAATSNGFSELANPTQPNPTGSETLDTVTGTISFADVDLTDRPVASAAFTSFTYMDASHHPLTLNEQQLADIFAVSIPLTVVQGAGNTNNGQASWTYSLVDKNFDFLAAGEILTLTYTATVDDGHGGVISTPITVTIVGTNDTPTIAATSNGFSELANQVQPNPTGSEALDTVSGTISFADVDLTDRPVASAAFTSFTYTDAGHHPLTLTQQQLADIAAVEIPLTVVQGAGNTNNGQATWTYSLADKNFDFMAVGEVLTLTYTATVDDGHGGVISTPFTVTIVGTNDTATVAATSNSFSELANQTQPNPTGSETLDTVSGTISFADVDLTDRPVASAAFASFTYTDAAQHPLTLTQQQLADISAVEIPLTVVQGAGNTNNGQATWTYSLADKNFDFMAVGEVLTLTYTATVNDNHGGVISTPFTVTIVGTNDTPTIAATSNGFSEQANQTQPNPTGSEALDTVSGTISFADVDLTDRPVASAVFASFTYTDAAHNPLTLDQQQLADIAAVEIPLTVVQRAGNTNNGQATWTYSLADKNFDFMAVGEVLTLTYTATVDDGHGGVVSTPFTVTIVGTNDTPTIAATSNGFSELANQTQPNPTGSQVLDTVSGTISFADVDLTDRPVASAAFTSFTYTDAAHNPLTLDQQQLADIAAVEIPLMVVQGAGNTNNGQASWTYSLADKNFDFLAAGEILILTYTATVDDNHGGVISTPFTVTIVGTNDTPTIAATSNSFSELANQTQPNPTGSETLDTVTGTISFADVDLTDRPVASAVFASFTYTDAAHNPLTLNQQQLADIIAVEIPLTVVQGAGNTNNGQASWTYSLADKNFDFLAAGEILTLTYTATVNDNHGGVVSTPFTVTIVGTNDTPTLAADSLASHPILERLGQTGDTVDNDTATGTLAFTDVDLTDTHTTSFGLSKITWSANATLPSGLTSVLTNAFSASVATDSKGTGTGSIRFTFSAPDNNFDFLAAGETLTLVYSVTVIDSQRTSSTQAVTIIVTGTNDAPVLDVAKTPVLNAENQGAGVPVNGTAAGTLVSGLVDLNPTPGGLDNVTDVDHGAVTGIALTGVDTSYGTWYYSIDGGAHWTQIGSLSTNSALLLAADANTRLYFAPAAGYSGTDSSAITFRAWDQTFGFNGEAGVDTSVNGGSTAFSTAVDTAAITINPINAPIVDLNGAASGFDNVIGYQHNSNSPVPIAPSAVISDATSTNLVSMTLTLTNPMDNSSGTGGVNIKEYLRLSDDAKALAAKDGLIVTQSGIYPISLTITGTASVADYQAILDGVQYVDTKTGFQDRDSRTITVVVSDGINQSEVRNVTVQVTAPAGVAGEPINLALADPSPDHLGFISATIAGLPSGWSLSEGVHNSDGTWTVQTNDIAALSVTSSSGYSGALVLDVAMTWTNANGSAGSALIPDNVEVYAKGSPIFAWSGNDTLTASSARDLLVFSQPIGHDTVHSFDASVDQIDLIGFAGFTGFADVLSHLSEDAGGDAVITISDGQSITLDGVHAAALTAYNFAFNQTPAFDNAGTMTVSDGALLPLSGIVDNTGTIALDSTGGQTDLQLIETGLTLEGGGKVLLSDSDMNFVAGTSPDVTLDNVDNTISGAGQIGTGALKLINGGTIDATGTHALTIDTGSNTIVNSGVLEASGSGGLRIDSAVENLGTLWANGAKLTVEGAVSGNGTAMIDGAGVLDLEAASTAKVIFGAGAAGTLQLNDAFHFNGTIAGFGGADVIDLSDMLRDGAAIGYQENAAKTGGMLTVSAGDQTVELSLLGHYTADNFHVVMDPAKGTMIGFVPQELLV